MKTIEKVATEIQTSREKYGPFNSTHEVYGVLIEEVEEFWELVRNKYMDDLPKKKNMINELTQIAAISLRAIDELEHGNIKWV